jgi:hypothetical protein
MRSVHAFLFLAMAAGLWGCDPDEPDTAECDKLAGNVLDAKSAFSDQWLECEIDSDCTRLPAVGCSASCEAPAVAKAHADDARNFMENDAAVSKACKAYNDSGCADKPDQPNCGASVPVCTSGKCN